MGNKLQETMFMTAASILYSCTWYDQVELYVDAIGYQYLQELPCKVTKVHFDTDQELWMKPKLYAIEQQSVPFVHIDTDVFIKQKIDFDFEDVIVERKDLNYYNYKELISFFNQFNDQIPFWNPNLDYAWSCGVIGFNDLKLRDNFINVFKTLEHIMKNEYKKYEAFRDNQDSQGWYIEPGLLLEQYNLTSLLFEKNIKPTVLIPEVSPNEQSVYANTIGYTHLLGASKYHSHNTNKIKSLLRHNFPKYYEIIRKQSELNLTKQLSKVI